jgi:hypothetical protein
MTNRPLSVTIICWALIGFGSLASVTFLFTANNELALTLMRKSPIPIPIQFAITAAGVAISILCAAFMLKGMGWARTLYIASQLVSFALGILTAPLKMALVPGIVLFAIECAFLYAPTANRFFAKLPSADAG